MASKIKRLTIAFASAVAFAAAVGAIPFAAHWLDDRAEAKALDRARSVGGRVERGQMLDYAIEVGRTTFGTSVGSFGRVHDFLWWSYYRKPDDVALVDLAEVQLSMEDCTAISRTRSCRILSLRNASLPSAGLELLMAIPELRLVDLRGIAVSDEALLILERNKDLSCLALTSSLVAPKCVARFERNRPSCEVLEE